MKIFKLTEGWVRFQKMNVIVIECEFEIVPSPCPFHTHPLCPQHEYVDADLGRSCKTQLS